MKKVLIAGATLLILVVVAMAIAIATFDVDRFRPLLVDKLASILGSPVRLRRISLGWQDGLAVHLDDLQIGQGDPTQPPFFDVERASAVVRLMPLLKRRVEISSVVLRRPSLHVVRDARGNLNLMSLAVVGGPAAASGKVLTVGETPVRFEVQSMRIWQGVLHWSDATMSPPRDLIIRALDVTVTHVSPEEPMDIDARGMLGATQPNLRVRGRLRLPSSTDAGEADQIRLTVEQLPLEYIMPVGAPEDPRLQGQLSLEFEGRVESLEPARLTHALIGKGQLKLSEPVIANLNVLRVALGKLSMIPGLVRRLEQHLPPEYQAKLAATDTILSPIDVSIQFADGALHFDELRLRSDTFEFTGAGQVGFDGTTYIPSTVRFDAPLSEAMIRSVKELRGLVNANGQIEFPGTVQGRAPRLAFVPDLNVIASKVVLTTAVDALGSLLRRAQGGEGARTEPASFLGGILQRVLEGDQIPEEPGPSPAVR